MKRFKKFLKIALIIEIILWVILVANLIFTLCKFEWYGTFAVDIYGDITGSYGHSLDGFFSRMSVILAWTSLALGIITLVNVLTFVFILKRELDDAIDNVERKEHRIMSLFKKKDAEKAKAKKASKKEKLQEAKENLAKTEEVVEQAEKTADTTLSAAQRFAKRLQK